MTDSPWTLRRFSIIGLVALVVALTISFGFASAAPPLDPGDQHATSDSNNFCSHDCIATTNGKNGTAIAITGNNNRIRLIVTRTVIIRESAERPQRQDTSSYTLTAAASSRSGTDKCLDTIREHRERVAAWTNGRGGGGFGG